MAYLKIADAHFYWYNHPNMTKPLEGDPTKRIVDIDRFTYYFVGYRYEIVANPPKAVDMRAAYGLGENIPGEIEEFGLGTDVRLENCPWETIPKSIQIIIAKGYPAAGLLEEKHVEVHIEKGAILFELQSPSVKEDIDTYGEVFTRHSVGLQVGDNPTVLFAPRGMWFIHKLPASAWIAMRGKTAQEKQEILHRTPPTTETFPHTLPQLHDLARFLEQSRPRAVVYRF